MSGVEAFVGSWVEEKKDGFDAFVQALGLPPEKCEFFKNAKTEISYAQNGDTWTITVGMQGVPQNRTFQFKLGENYNSASLDGSPLTSCMHADGDKFVETHHDEAMNADMDIVRHIEGDKMIVTTKVGNLEMTSTYGRI